MSNVFTNHLASAQSNKFSDNLKFGIKGGFNWTSSNDEDRVQDNKVSPRPGLHIRGLVNYYLTGKWALQPEVTYSKEGAKYDFPGSATIAKYEGKTDISFVNLPILVQYMILPAFRVQKGPQFGYATSIKYEDPYNEETDKEDIQKGNFSWSIGFEYITKFGFSFNARYNAGFSNMYKEGYYSGQAARTRAGQFGFFYLFK